VQRGRRGPWEGLGEVMVEGWVWAAWGGVAGDRAGRRVAGGLTRGWAAGGLTKGWAGIEHSHKDQVPGRNSTISEKTSE